MKTVSRGIVHLLLVILFLSCGGDDDTKTYSVGGTVSGLSGSLELQCNGADDITVTSDGTFVFPTELKKGKSYSVTVSSQPTGQTCMVANGSGTIPNSNVTNVSVECHNSGTLDTSFGTGGFVVHDLSRRDYGNSITIDTRGRILVSGQSVRYNTAFNDTVVWRFNEDGTLDTSFDSDGFVIHHSAAGGGEDDRGFAITTDSNGRILVAGQSHDSYRHTAMVLWGYNQDGTLDTTFDSDGIVLYDGGSNDSGYSITTDSSGRILVAGYINKYQIGKDMAIWRYNLDGTLDTTFDSDGIVLYDSGSDDFGHSITTDSNGRILVAGISGPGSNYDMALWRYNEDGTLDTSFDSDGIVVHAGAAGGNYYDMSYSVTTDVNDRILVTGYSENVDRDKDMVIWRYNEDGSLDTTFDSDGIVIYDGGDKDFGYSITTDSSERILVAGCSINPGKGYDMVIWRYNEDGSLDTTFNSDGKAMHNGAAGGGTADYGSSITTDSIGRILVSGRSKDIDGDFDMVIWRYWPHHA